MPRKRDGFDVAKDLVKGLGLCFSPGICITQEHENLFRGRFGPPSGVGFSMSF